MIQAINHSPYATAKRHIMMPQLKLLAIATNLWPSVINAGTANPAMPFPALLYSNFSNIEDL
jgi:hypothetical protein